MIQHPEGAEFGRCGFHNGFCGSRQAEFGQHLIPMCALMHFHWLRCANEMDHANGHKQ